MNKRFIVSMSNKTKLKEVWCSINGVWSLMLLHWLQTKIVLIQFGDQLYISSKLLKE